VTGLPNNATTQLNPGAGGDLMDESLVVQAPLSTQAVGTSAKRPRVVPGGDDGSLQTFEAKGDRTEGHVQDASVRRLLESILEELQAIRRLTEDKR
jgi:hypothetical protein